MAIQIRQEINIVNTAYQGVGVASNTVSKELIQLDTTQYNGTVTYYFEIVAKGDLTGAGVQVISLRRSDGTSEQAITVTDTSSTYTLYRSTSFTPPAGQTTYYAQINAGTLNTGAFFKSARIVIIQNATTLTNTETQIEIGNASNTTTTTDTALTNPKYWQYTSANWDGTLTAYFESTFLTGTSKSAATMTLQTSTGIAAPSWSNVASSAVTTTGTVATRVRSGAITLVAGNWYRAVMKAGNSKSGITVYNAKIIIDQVDGGQLISGGTADENVGGNAALGANAQAFKVQANSSITGVKLRLKKGGSPTDTINIDLVSSLGGTSLANGTISASTLTTSFAVYTTTFTTPYMVTGGSTYYIQISRSPDVTDSTNLSYVEESVTASVYADGNRWLRSGGTWSESTTRDLYFELTGTLGITKLEPQYLLANTLFAAGTGLQTFLTKWDSTEWDAGAGTVTYYSQAEAANDSTSDVTIDQADGGGTVTNSTLTNVDNAQISVAMTMPASENLDTKATTNAGDVAAARILVAYVFSAAAEVPEAVYTNPNLKALLYMGVGK